MGTEDFTEKYRKRVYVSHLMCNLGFAVSQEG